MRTESKYLAELELTEGPEDIKEQQQLEKEAGFSYRQVIGESVFAMSLRYTQLDHMVARSSTSLCGAVGKMDQTSTFFRLQIRQFSGDLARRRTNFARRTTTTVAAL